MGLEKGNTLEKVFTGNFNWLMETSCYRNISTEDKLFL